MRESIPQRREPFRYGRGVEGRMRTLARLSVSAAAVLGAIGCSGQEGDPGCGDGFTGQSRTNEVERPGAETRDDAIRAELEELRFEASDEAVTDAVVNAIPVADPPGHEAVSVRTSEGFDVEMTLTPLDPGWAVDGSSWCEPVER
jgi:hypothetical protein